MPVDHGEEKIIILAQIFFNTADHHRAVGVANFFGDYANGISSFQSQSACKKIRPVVERFRSLDDAILGLLGDGTRCGGVVQGGRHRPRGKPEMPRDGLEGNADLAAWGGSLSRRGRHLWGSPRISQNL